MQQVQHCIGLLLKFTHDKFQVVDCDPIVIKPSLL